MQVKSAENLFLLFISPPPFFFYLSLVSWAGIMSAALNWAPKRVREFSKFAAAWTCLLDGWYNFIPFFISASQGHYRTLSLVHQGFKISGHNLHQIYWQSTSFS